MQIFVSQFFLQRSQQKEVSIETLVLNKYFFSILYQFSEEIISLTREKEEGLRQVFAKRGQFAVNRIGRVDFE